MRERTEFLSSRTLSYWSAASCSNTWNQWRPNALFQFIFSHALYPRMFRLSTFSAGGLHPKMLCRFVAPYFAGPENPQRLNSRPCLGPAKGSPAPYFSYMGGRAFGPPLCRGCAPATPPYKNMPPRPVCLLRRGAPVRQCACRQPTTFRRKPAWCRQWRVGQEWRQQRGLMA